MRLVLDVNVLVSGLVFGGGPARLIELWQQQAFRIVTCPRLLDETEAVLRRSKFMGRIDQEQIAAFMVLLRDDSEVVDDPSEPSRISRDPDDDYVVALAVESGVDALVTGDLDLLEVDDPPVLIVAPKDALELLAEG